MKKIILQTLLLIIIMPVVVNADDRLIITYDANDETGRTKVVELEKGDSYSVLGNDIFLAEENSDDNPINDKIIDRWCKNKDCSNGVISLFSTYKENPLNSLENDNYNFFNDSSELTLYADWTNRKDIKDLLNKITVLGDGVIEKDNGDYEIEKNKDFEINFYFKEKFNNQLGQLSFFALPNYFTCLITDEAKDVLAKPTNLPIKITTSSGMKIFNGSFFVKNDNLFIDFIRDGTSEAHSFFSATNVSFRITYKVSYTEERRNSHVFYSVSLTVGLNGVEDRNVIVYPTGKIITSYVDIETGEKIIPDSIKTDVLGEIYNTESVDIDGYKLIEKPDSDRYEFDEEQQVIYFKYKKNTESKDENKNQIENFDTIKNPNTGIGSSIVLIFILVISFITYIATKLRKKC